MDIKERNRLKSLTQKLLATRLSDKKYFYIDFKVKLILLFKNGTTRVSVVDKGLCYYVLNVIDKR